MLVKVKATLSCATLCDPMDYTVPGILQTRILEWVAFPFARGSFQPRDRAPVSQDSLPTELSGKPRKCWVKLNKCYYKCKAEPSGK